MNEKYLPIGTICTIKGQQKKVMITGYYSVEYVGNLKFKDYSGCLYPEGLLLPNSNVSFNHSEIESIDYMGYENEEFTKFKQLISNLSENEKVKSSVAYTKFEFDENGVVTIAEPIFEEETVTAKTSLIESIQLDSNDYVVKSDLKEVENPFHKEYSNDVTKEPAKSKWKIFNNIEFDEAGNVISATSDEGEVTTYESLNEIKFDDAGDMIPSEQTKIGFPPLENIKFDENGMIIEANGIKYEG